jgi:hypothetical protein
MQDEFAGHKRRSTMYAELRDLFGELGGNVPMRVLGDSAVARGVIPPEEVKRCTDRGIQEICRRALKVRGENGLPFAKPTSSTRDDDGNVEWKQLELFTYDEAAALIVREAKAVVDDYVELQSLHRWCTAKFGRAPEIPQLIELHEA